MPAAMYTPGACLLACTMPWHVVKQLTQNDFTDTGKEQFERYTYLLTTKVQDVVQTENIMLRYEASIFDALIYMTKTKLGALWNEE
jgi:predicted nucleic acid-binding protein